MEKKATSGTLLTLLLIVPLTLAFGIQSVWAVGTIYIRADGSIDPPTASIQRDGDIYSFTADIYDSIVIEKDNIVVDGNGHMIQGAMDYGFFLSERSNVTIKNTVITGFSSGITLYSSSKNTISNNTFVSNQWFGISIAGGSIINPSSNNTIVNNSVSESACGIQVHGGGEYYNRMENNKIFSNTIGIQFSENARYNVISGNSLSNNDYGFMIMERPVDDENYGNKIFHNNFVENTHQAVDNGIDTMWDDGYPSGGNYWSDYAGVDANSDGIGDGPYVIDENNQDRFPLMNPWCSAERIVGVEIGSWVKYSNFDISWSSNDPDATMPSGLSILREVEWLENSVEDILDSKIKYQQLLRFRDGSEYSATCWIDIDTGSGTPLSFVSSGLVSDDCVYASAPWYAWKINETISHMCVGVNRETNHLNVTTSMQVGPPPAYRNTTGNFYWDKETGVLCELSMRHLNQTESYVTSWSVFYEIVDTNLWKAPVVSASVCIDPDTLHLKGHGRWITAYIQLPESYNPEDIDAFAILLNGTIAPVLDPKYDFVTNSSEYLVDHNNDGILERMVKFDRANMVSWIYQSVGMQHEVSLTMTGELADGTPFEGTDTIFVAYSGGGSGRRK